MKILLISPCSEEDITNTKVKRSLFRAFLIYRKMLTRMFWYYLVQVTPDHRKAFFTILRTTLHHAPYMLPQMIFLHTRFMIQHKRYQIASKLARERATWERAHPDELKLFDRSLPIPQKIRESAKEIFTLAYQNVRKKVSDRETIYKIVIKAMVDYIDRFGEVFERLDDYHREYINESCDRIMAYTQLPKFSGSSDLPREQIPPHFEREILDGIDYVYRAHIKIS